MDIRFLSTFLEVASTRHFGKAADNLYLTQSAISARIKLLEEYFDVALFERHRNSIQLTPAGEKLLPYAKQLCKQLQDTKNAMKQENTLIVVCACTPNSYATWLASYLADIGNHMGDVSLRSELASIEVISRQLHDHAIDIGFTTEPLKLDNVVHVKVAEIKLGLLCLSEAKNVSDYIHIEWSPKISEQLFNLYPDYKHGDLTTNYAEIGLSQLKQRPNACALLPLDFVADDTRGLRRVNEEFQAKLNIYMSTLDEQLLGHVEKVRNHFHKNS